MFPLARHFSIASAVTIGVAMIAVTSVVTEVTTQQLIEERETANVALTQAFSNSIWPAFRSHVERSAELDADALRALPDTERLSEAVRTMMSGLSVVKVKVYAMNGNTVFSTQDSQMGTRKDGKPGFRSARSGQVATEISHRDAFSAFEQEVFDINVVSSYVPIRGLSGEIEGVFEVYDDVTQTLQKLQERRNIIIVVIGILFVSLYLILFLIVRRAAKLMRQQHQKLIEAKSELEAKNGALAKEIDMRHIAQTELQAAQDTLVQKERLAALGQLTATVSHELRNPLGAIRTSLFFARQKTDGKGLGIERALDRAERNIMRCDNIITELLDFARDSKLEREEVVADDWLRLTLEDQETHEGIEIVTAFGTPGVKLAFDQERMRRAVINVFDNATQAMADNPADRPRRLTIGTRVREGRLEMTFNDTGPGMDAQTLTKIFEPLFSTKSFGVGLGVPTVKKIVEGHGGGIDYESQIGTGTTVVLWLPLDAPQQEAA